MKSLKSFLLLVCLLTICVLPNAALGQQRRQPPRPNVKPTTQQITFDTLLGTDRYKIYAEVRNVGQLIRSNSVNELLEPVMKLAGPPQEFRKFIKWIDAHSEDVMTSKVLFATWPTAPNLPDAVFAIEFDSSEEASKFLPQLNTFLPKVLPPQPAPSPSPNDQKPTSKSEDAPVKSSFFIKQVGSLIVISSGPINLKDLRPSASKLLADQPSFRVARNRFTSEQIFVYVDVNSIEKEDEERRKQYEEDEKKRSEEKANAPVISEASPSPQEGQGEAPPEEQRVNPAVDVPNADQPATPVPTPDPLTTAVGMIFNSFFISEAKWPDGIGVGISFEHESFDVRALMVSAPGERCDVVPFVPNLKVGSPIVPESPSILPADTELFATLSLDLPQILAAMNRMPPSFENLGPQRMPVAAEPSFLPVARVEAIL
jgi:hypothetical protein